MNDKISYYRIEKYISGVMGEDEKRMFEDELQHNAALREAYELQKELVAPLSFHKMFPVHAKESNAKNIVHRFLELMIQPQLQMVATVMIVGFVALMMLYPNGETDVRYRAKGRAIVDLLVNNSGISSDTEVEVFPGDTVSLTYRSSDSLFVQVWFSDDGGNLLPYISNNGKPLVLEPVNSAVPFPSSIILDSNWQKEHIVVLYATKYFELIDNDGRFELPKAKHITARHFKLVNIGKGK